MLTPTNIGTQALFLYGINYLKRLLMPLQLKLLFVIKSFGCTHVLAYLCYLCILCISYLKKWRESRALLVTTIDGKLAREGI